MTAFWLLNGVAAEHFALLGLGSLDQLIEQTVPESIRIRKPLDLPAPARTPPLRKSHGS